MKLLRHALLTLLIVSQAHAAEPNTTLLKKSFFDQAKEKIVAVLKNRGFQAAVVIVAVYLARRKFFAKKTDQKAGLPPVVEPAAEPAACVICGDPLRRDLCTRLTCAHNENFHRLCLNRWVNGHQECPVCRSNIPPSLERTVDLLNAINNGDEAEATAALNAGASINATAQDTISNITHAPLHLAVARSEHRMVRLLLDRGASLYQSDGNNTPALHYAIREDNQVDARILLEHERNTVGMSRLALEVNASALDMAINENRPAMVGLVLDYINPNMYTTAPLEERPLHRALKARFPNPEIVRLLVEHDANVNATNGSNERPLDIAMRLPQAFPNTQTIVELLTSRGAHTSAPQTTNPSRPNSSENNRRNVNERRDLASIFAPPPFVTGFNSAPNRAADDDDPWTITITADELARFRNGEPSSPITGRTGNRPRTFSGSQAMRMRNRGSSSHPIFFADGTFSEEGEDGLPRFFARR